MKIRAIFSKLALLLAVSASIASASECPTPDCTFATTQRPWPAEAAPATPSYFLGAFAFGLPAGWTRLYAPAGEMFSVDYPDDGERLIGFTWLRAGAVTPLHQTLAASGLTARDFYDMVFGLSSGAGVPEPIREDVVTTRRAQFPGSTSLSAAACRPDIESPTLGRAVTARGGALIENGPLRGHTEDVPALPTASGIRDYAKVRPA